MAFRKSKLTIKQILAWADHHHKHTGRWPIAASGTIPGAPHEVWRRINTALQQGLRGLPGGSSLARLLAEQRNARYGKYAPRLTTKQVLAWADAHHKRTGEWPSLTSGPVVGTRTETWSNINQCLQGGLRGLPGGSTIAKLLVEERDMISPGHRPKLTSKQILLWADQHHRRTGQWPKQTSGPVAGTQAENWAAISHSLLSGFRGLPGGSTIAKLLYVKRGVNSQRCQQGLSVACILAWARAHHHRTGKWPTFKSGRVVGAAGETWSKIDTALRRGLRQLRGQSSLYQLLKKHG
ncbi:MAG: hypothetical protein IH895_03700 [Planctomycetes bacterium]|nr:hypothetical protein [Planctomycetota bacterium]